MEWSSKRSSIRQSLPSIIPNHCAFPTMSTKSIGYPSGTPSTLWVQNFIRTVSVSFATGRGKVDLWCDSPKASPSCLQLPQFLISWGQFTVDFSLAFNMGHMGHRAAGKHSASSPPSCLPVGPRKAAGWSLSLHSSCSHWALAITDSPRRKAVWSSIYRKLDLMFVRPLPHPWSCQGTHVSHLGAFSHGSSSTSFHCTEQANYFYFNFNSIYASVL